MNTLYDWKHSLTMDELDALEEYTKAQYVDPSSNYLSPMRYIRAAHDYTISDEARSLFSSLVRKQAIVIYARKDVGSLWKYNLGNEKSYTTVPFLYSVPHFKQLNNKQLEEVEGLLNKVGQTLGINIPSSPPAPEIEIKRELLRQLISVVEDKPVFYWRNTMEHMGSLGYENDVSKEDFLDLAKKFLTI